MTIAFFDFDGTITTKDTMLQFIRFSKGNLMYYTGLVLLLPVLAAFKMGVIPNWRAKEMLFSFYFKGMEVQKAILLGQEFCQKVVPQILRREAVREIEFHQKAGTKMVVVTASFPIWIKPWCDSHQFELIATGYDIKEGKLTGSIKGKNCQGDEKVQRIKEQFDLSQYEKIYAYGDSNGDYKMLNLADVKYMKWKKIC